MLLITLSKTGTVANAHISEFRRPRREDCHGLRPAWARKSGKTMEKSKPMKRSTRKHGLQGKAGGEKHYCFLNAAVLQSNSYRATEHIACI